MSLATDNLRSARGLLAALVTRGLRDAVICPGSRSGPLTSAAHQLEQRGQLRLHPCIDERSAAFHALGMARGAGRATAVITTSGTAVANLLPAAVEAHHSGLPLLLLTADRPRRLKHCGANQTVDQERFLEPCCRWLEPGPEAGLAMASPADLTAMAGRLWQHAHGRPAGPVHGNLPFEEPLHPGAEALQDLDAAAADPAERPLSVGDVDRPAPTGTAPPADPLDLSEPGVIVAGPWRGRPQDHPAWLEQLGRISRRLAWPVLADPLSGVRGAPGIDTVLSHELVLAEPPAFTAASQVLRLGPMPASRPLQRWLSSLQTAQLLLMEGDARPHDPLRRALQRSDGLLSWWRDREAGAPPEPMAGNQRHSQDWLAAEAAAQAVLEAALPLQGPISEPALARWLPRLLPEAWPVMLASSSPVRDWLRYGPGDAPQRWIDGFRGASGIDGTLSLAMGLARSLGRLVLVCGDLALLHDSNGWLWGRELGAALTVLLIDNGGGGIFEQLPIRLEQDTGEDERFERLFAMPQSVNPRTLAAAHGVPSRVLQRLEDLPAALEWSLAQPLALLHLPTHRRADAARRRSLAQTVSVRMKAQSAAQQPGP
ncbi:2-succinyl-5-enolpyruvyl-6-hydroxy-3-cyclohexene-1-carboxylic-acid synthase [Synechococcus sp. RSCCF101]|uniref:2-succinyl-5-enolpyruvyl-6-hydroxy-3- cyclohexene-1-carboxylic-acid synthase n=1 Tax=Synechococcus sp. RSCCF101 TaxID=2511069 RepID=UPI0012491680|nr:2-succinyl-5-enolpyruvyl-6-hydroxy-3-cyclohexene-1-carboxylic-acid synthase [Synechococcus sp. RSCCF101]QEY31453.1 2-succinyl-5-enolpyruvyl-6-hydroxy-3-cyclohexene-1-carboxylic-acid synthase [Synechococcus sp. RSCCF101]